MAGFSSAFRFPRRRAAGFPFDAVGALALAWSAAFLALAFALGGAIR